MAFQKGRVTVVIPTKNEADMIGKMVRRVNRYAGEVLVVDGHSTDGTRKKAEEAGARVVLDHGRGKGDGLRVALKEAEKEIVVFIDADGSHDPRDIPKVVVPILQGKADLVLTSRMTGGSDELSGTVSRLFRMLGGIMITLIINYRFRVRFTDSQNGFRAIRKRVGLKLGLKADKFDIETEMLMKALKNGYKVVEVSSHEYERAHGKSGINLWRMWYWYVWRLLVNLV